MQSRFSLVLLAPLVLSASAAAQNYYTGFHDADGWTLDSDPGPFWAVDATPAAAPAGPFRSAGASLNFNDGVDIGETSGFVGHGTADSPPIDISGDISGGDAPLLSFWCNFDSEQHCVADARVLIVSNNDFDMGQAQLVFECMNDLCPGPGFWHRHELALDPAWGVVRVRFDFNVWDTMHNGGAGWFVDDFTIQSDAPIGSPVCAPAVPNSTTLPGELIVTGNEVVAEDDLTLFAVQLPAGSNVGYFIMGTGSNTFVPPGSAGPICVAPGLKRFLPPVNNTNELGGGFSRVVGTRGPVSGNITPGSTWTFQAWHRDAGAGSSNLTQGVSVTFQ